jgi:hypothetical protein
MYVCFSQKTNLKMGNGNVGRWKLIYLSANKKGLTKVIKSGFSPALALTS